MNNYFKKGRNGSLIRPIEVFSLNGAQSSNFPASDWLFGILHPPLWLVELETLEFDTLNPDRLIWISTVETYDFLNHLIWYTQIGRI